MTHTPYVFRGIAVPDDTMDTINAYVKQGRPTGDFLRAVINNNLRDAIGRADEENLKALPAIVAYFYNCTPMACWGHPGYFERWIELKRKERDTREEVGAERI